MTLESRIFYLYGVIPRGQEPPSFEQGPLEVVEAGSLAALVDRVPADAFSPAVLEERMKSVEEVAPIARRHQAVLAEAMRKGPVVPARLLTLFSTRDAVAQCLVSDESRFRETIERVSGCAEWGLKVRCNEGVLAAAMAEAPAIPEGLSAAQTFLFTKKHEAEAAERVDERLDEVVEEVLDVVEQCTLESREKPQRADGGEGTLALTVAVLVKVDGCEAFQAAADELAQKFAPEGFTFELSGPWPPYSFLDAADELREKDSL